MEDWAPIKEFPGYSVSTRGRIRNDKTDRILTLRVNQDGVVYVGLMQDGRQRQRSVALLVATEWIPRPFGPMDTPINLNGDRYDNTVDNLQWRPRWFAVKYNQQFKHPYENPLMVPIRDVETGREYENSWVCALEHGLLEKDLVLSILNRTVVWPTLQKFEVIEV